MAGFHKICPLEDMMNLSEMTKDALIELRAEIDTELASRESQVSETFTVEFLESNRTNGTAIKPYAARVVGISEKYGFERQFIDLEKTYGNKEIIVEGDFDVSEGEVIELQTGGTSKNPHRDWHIAVGGELHKIGATDSADNKRNLKRYFQGKMTVSELIGD